MSQRRIYANLVNILRSKDSMCAATLLSPIIRELGCPQSFRKSRQFFSSFLTLLPITEMCSRISRNVDSFMFPKSSLTLTDFHLGSLRVASELKAPRCFARTYSCRTDTAPTHDKTTAARKCLPSRQAMVSSMNARTSVPVNLGRSDRRFVRRGFAGDAALRCLEAKARTRALPSSVSSQPWGSRWQILWLWPSMPRC
jgi:hypothetical protein